MKLPNKQSSSSASLIVIVVILCCGGVIVYNQITNINFDLTMLSSNAVVTTGMDTRIPQAETETVPIQNTIIIPNEQGESDPQKARKPRRKKFDMAYRDSGGFLNDITNANWELMKKRVKERTNYFDPHIPNRNIKNPPLWYQENFEPDFTCQHERRIGGMGDGPKWVCDPHRLVVKQDCLVYSVGSAGNFKFETSILKEIGHNCEIHTFDPEIKGKRFGHLAPEGVNYHNWGFTSDNNTGKQQEQAQQLMNKPQQNQTSSGIYKTMKDTIKELGHEGRVIDIFKIDCEGCEWKTFHGWFDAGATLQQILVEVHRTPKNKVHDFFLGMQKAGYVTFHKEANLFTGGKCVEYAFLKMKDSFFQDM